MCTTSGRGGNTVKLQVTDILIGSWRYTVIADLTAILVRVIIIKSCLASFLGIGLIPRHLASFPDTWPHSQGPDLVPRHLASFPGT